MASSIYLAIFNNGKNIVKIKKKSDERQLESKSGSFHGTRNKHWYDTICIIQQKNHREKHLATISIRSIEKG